MLVYVSYPYFKDLTTTRDDVSNFIQGLKDKSSPIYGVALPALNGSLKDFLKFKEEHKNDLIPPGKVLTYNTENFSSDDFARSTFLAPVLAFDLSAVTSSYKYSMCKHLEMLSHCDVLLLCNEWVEDGFCLADFGYALAKRMPIVFEDIKDYYKIEKYYDRITERTGNV